jgi:hypothetical protein
MKSTMVTLAGKQYELQPLPIRKAREIRTRFAEPLAGIIDALKAAPKVELNDLQGIGSLLDAAKIVLVGSIDLALEILFEYSPEIAADRPRIEDEAFDDEAITAFVEVVKQLYPFGGLINSLPGPKR